MQRGGQRDKNRNMAIGHPLSVLFRAIISHVRWHSLIDDLPLSPFS